MSLKQFFFQLGGTGEQPIPDIPLQISDLVLWLDPDSCRDSGGSLPDDGEAVATWLDKSGNGNTCTGVNSPLYRTSSIGGIGGVEFEETSNQYFTQTGVTPKNNQTIFVVFKRSDSSDTTGKILVGSEDEDNERCKVGTLLREINSGYGSVASYPGDISLENNWAHIACWHWNDTSDDFVTRLDRWEEVNTTHDGLDIDANNDYPFWIGDLNKQGVAAGSDFDGWISEVLIYDKELNSTEIATIEVYLRDKYSFILSPEQISGMSLWVSPDSLRDSGGAFPDHGEVITHWLDKSGQDNHCTSSGTPYYDSAGIVGLMSTGSARLVKANNDYFTHANVWKNNMTTFMIWNQVTGSTAVQVLMGSRQSGANNVTWYTYNNDHLLDFCSDDGNILLDPFARDTNYVGVYYWNNTADDLKARVNFVEKLAITHDGTDLEADNTYPGWIGDQNNLGSPDNLDYDGHVAEVIMYDKELDLTTEIQQLEHYYFKPKYRD